MTKNKQIQRGKAFPLIVLALATYLSAEDKSETPAVTSSRALKLSGYTQVLYTAQDDGIDGFSLRRARLTLAGELLKNLRYKIQVDAVKSPILMDALVEFAFHEAANVRLGQFKVPFGLEGPTSSADLDTINRATFVSKLSPGHDIGASGRDIGAAFFGKTSFFEYTLAALNGAGINKTDTNEDRDWVGRLIIRPTSFLAIGASAYDGKFSASPYAASVKRDRLGLDLAFNYQDLAVKGEFIQAGDGETTRLGWYGQAGYFFMPKTLQGLIRFDSYDPDTNVVLDRLAVWTLGANWFLSGKTKLQINFELTKDESGRTVNKALLVQFQAAF